MKTHASIGSLLALSAFALGCTVSLGASSRGDLDRVDFSYRESCFWGCSLDEPVLADSHERISVTGPGNDDGITVGSSNPGVATFLVVRSCVCDRSTGGATDASGEVQSLNSDGSCEASFDKHCDNSIVTKTHSAGDAKLELYAANGEIVDRTTIRVRAASSVGFERTDDQGDRTAIDRLELAPGDSVLVSAAPATDDGSRILGAEGFSWSSDDAKVAGFEDSLFQLTSQAPAGTGRSMFVKAEQAGITTLHVGAGGGSGSIEIIVSEPLP